MRAREPSSSGRPPGETEPERLARNWEELLQELRVLQTGVQILAAFLLTVPFQQRFTVLSAGQRMFYLVLVLLALCTVGVLLTPVSLHRQVFRKGYKREVVEWADRLSVVALVLAGLVIIGCCFFVADMIASLLAASLVAAGATALLAGLWWMLPSRVRQGRGKIRRSRLR